MNLHHYGQQSVSPLVGTGPSLWPCFGRGLPGANSAAGKISGGYGIDLEPEPLCPIFVSSAASIKLLLMARVATDKIGLTIAEDADNV